MPYHWVPAAFRLRGRAATGHAAARTLFANQHDGIDVEIGADGLRDCVAWRVDVGFEHPAVQTRCCRQCPAYCQAEQEHQSGKQKRLDFDPMSDHLLNVMLAHASGI